MTVLQFVVNGMKIKDLQLINNGEQVLAFPGTTLFHLENELRPLKREPHSVIGSSNLGLHRSLVVLQQFWWCFDQKEVSLSQSYHCMFGLMKT